MSKWAQRKEVAPVHPGRGELGPRWHDVGDESLSSQQTKSVLSWHNLSTYTDSGLNLFSAPLGTLFRKMATPWEFPGGTVVKDSALSQLWLGFNSWPVTSTTVGIPRFPAPPPKKKWQPPGPTFTPSRHVPIHFIFVILTILVQTRLVWEGVRDVVGISTWKQRKKNAVRLNDLPKFEHLLNPKEIFFLKNWCI